ncbi:HAD family hydrolase [Leucothrix arctica]|uniref:HAD family hydrolase n=1 Tax=Leucothrix arctica TaxID=1481894 RepID=A0A317CAX0_9GAMM|nr:HAD family phosphatase [Leucothrix arctica]PWQ95676.1 HAD family hydrolase [Leucothrix arctica]
MKKYILFDHDGVLVETEQWYYRANQRALAPFGIQLPRDAYLVNMSNGVTTWKVARDAGVPEREIDRARVLRDQYYQEYLASEDIEINGVLETLDILASDYRMGIITTSKLSDFALIHENRSILDYMAFVITRQDYEQAKPHPEPYLKGLQRFGVSAAEAVAVEDSARGLKSAVAAGIDCIAVANEFTVSHDMSKAVAKVDLFTDLPLAINTLKTTE